MGRGGTGQPGRLLSLFVVVVVVFVVVAVVVNVKNKTLKAGVKKNVYFKARWEQLKQQKIKNN